MSLPHTDRVKRLNHQLRTALLCVKEAENIMSGITVVPDNKHALLAREVMDYLIEKTTLLAVELRKKEE